MSVVAPNRDVMTVAEVADRLGISRNHAYALCAAGELPVLRLGHKIVIPIGRFEQWLAGGGVATPEHV
jgi:excisionase family DNA binding protein